MAGRRILVIYFYRGRDRVPYYELKTKDIGKASVQTVITPAATLAR